MSIAQAAKHFFFYGTTFAEYMKKHRTTAMVQFSPVKVLYIRNARLFIEHPMVALGFLIYQTVRYGSALLGLLSAFLHWRPTLREGSLLRIRRQ